MKTLPASSLLIKGYFAENYIARRLDATVPMVVAPLCPCDASELSTVCTLVGRRGEQHIRIGCCPTCGYIGYIDRVTQDWLISYNSEIYDNPDRIDIEREVTRRRGPPSEKDIRKGAVGAQLVRTTRADFSKPVLEIGTGYGSTLKYLGDLGFSKAIGMENSRHRAEIGRQAYGLEILHGAFEDPRVQSRLGELAPFGLVYSHHVLEHVYDVKEVLAIAAALQDEGDYLVSILPSFFRESTETTLFNLCHQHLFTTHAFEKILNRSGYEVTDDSLNTSRELNLVARKTLHPQARFKAEGIDYVERAANKFASALKLWPRDSKPRQRTFFQKIYRIINRDRKVYRSFMAGALHRWFETKVRHRPMVTTAVVVGRTNHRYTDPASSPLEMQFEGDIVVLH